MKTGHGYTSEPVSFRWLIYNISLAVGSLQICWTKQTPPTKCSRTSVTMPCACGFSRCLSPRVAY